MGKGLISSWHTGWMQQTTQKRMLKKGHSLGPRAEQFLELSSTPDRCVLFQVVVQHARLLDTCCKQGTHIHT